MKKQISILIVLFASMGVMLAENIRIGELYYALDADSRTAYVSYEHPWASDNYAGLVTATIPSTVTHEGIRYTVTGIGSLAFENCSSLESVVLPSTITFIGNWAFHGCSNLREISLSDHLTAIGEGAFSQCVRLQSLYLPSTMTDIGICAFSGCSGLTTVTLPSDLRRIRDRAFEGCYKIGTITLPDSIKSIGDKAFYECYALSCDLIPNSLDSLGENVLYKCYGIRVPLYNQKYFVFMPPMSRTAEYSIPEGIVQIAGGAFKDCQNLTTVTFPKSLRYIKAEAFYNCTRLRALNNFQREYIFGIGDDSFYNCIQLQTPIYSRGTFAFLPRSYSGAYSIPDGIVVIAGGAFRNCTGLTAIHVPNSVSTVRDEAFEGCTGLSAVTIPSAYLGARLYKGCTGLREIYSPNGTGYTQGLFEGVDTTHCIVYVRSDYVESYKKAKGWKTFKNILPLPEK